MVKKKFVDADVNVKGTILFKSTLLSWEPFRDVQLTFIWTKQEARDLVLHINENKIKYMVATSAPKIIEAATPNGAGQVGTISIRFDNFSYLV